MPEDPFGTTEEEDAKPAAVGKRNSKKKAASGQKIRKQKKKTMTGANAEELGQDEAVRTVKPTGAPPADSRRDKEVETEVEATADSVAASSYPGKITPKKKGLTLKLKLGTSSGTPGSGSKRATSQPRTVSGKKRKHAPNLTTGKNASDAVAKKKSAPEVQGTSTVAVGPRASLIPPSLSHDINAIERRARELLAMEKASKKMLKKKKKKENKDRSKDQDKKKDDKDETKKK